MEIPSEALEVVRARQRRELYELDYRRALWRLAEQGHSQREISRWVGIAQPSVQGVLRTASKTPMVPEGFSGADPFEICERYAAELMSREQLVDELTRWPYAPLARTTGPVDDLIVDEPGSWADVDKALQLDLIDDELYDEIGELIEKGAEEQLGAV